MQDHHARSVAKAIRWRVLATTTTAVIVLVLTGKLILALSVGGIEAVSKIILYYFHERIWNLIAWGRSNLTR